MKIGGKLKALRNDQGIGIKKLAGHLDVDYSYLSKIENDKANPSRETISRIARYFKCDIDELLILSEKLPPDVEKIFEEHPIEAITYLRRRFGGEHKS
jgi:transcriptional regulator with XRE-family HTH domain